MSISHYRRRMLGRVAPMALAVQCCAVFAMPGALCCCLAMAAEGHGPGHTSDATVATGSHGDDACPHRDVASAETRDSGTGTGGCEHLDQYVMALAGLMAATVPSPEFSHTLSLSGMVLSSTPAADDHVLPVESPPPRA